jgi:catechol 2,3-dioxygenase-like lactoylglutathione lyase family enzyme
MGPVELKVSFFHCNARHHSLAIAQIPAPEVPQKLHHINFEVKQVADVGAAYDRALAAGTPLANMLRVMAQENRDMRMSEAEKKAAGLPPKLTVPMILFFLPVLFVVILGPAVIKVMKRAGSPMNVDAVLQGLKNDKYVWNVSEPKKNLAARIYTLPGVKKVGPGMFALKK